jgi:hypothetical protein
VCSQQALPRPNIHLRRHRPNIVLVGPLITQERVKEDVCHQVSQTRTYTFLLKAFGTDYKTSCRNFHTKSVWDGLTQTTKFAALDNSPFGVDPTFLESSSLYRETNADIIDDLYNTDEVYDTGVPYGFFVDSGAGDDFGFPGDGQDYRFPIIFDVNTNASRASDMITYLRDGNYLDRQSSSFKMRIITFNPELSLFAYITIETSASTGGGFSFVRVPFFVDAPCACDRC